MREPTIVCVLNRAAMKFRGLTQTFIIRIPAIWNVPIRKDICWINRITEKDKIAAERGRL